MLDDGRDVTGGILKKSPAAVTTRTPFPCPTPFSFCVSCSVLYLMVHGELVATNGGVTCEHGDVREFDGRRLLFFHLSTAPAQVLSGLARPLYFAELPSPRCCPHGKPDSPEPS